MFKFITKQNFFVNLLVAILLAFLLVVIFFNSLDWLTHHDENVRVPVVTGRNVTEATQLLQSQGFEVEVQDSVYIDSAAKSSVIRQSPEADAIVKKSRTIYLTVNRALAPLVEMPDLRGFSFQSAELYLQSLGLRLGDTSYRPDYARNSVLEQRYKGQALQPGTKISMGSGVSLVLGDGVGNAYMNVPNIVGMTLSDARSYLESMNVNVGALVANGDVHDQSNAYIYRQTPPPFTTSGDGERTKNKIHPGQSIDVYLSVEQPVVDTAAQSEPPADNGDQ